MSSGSSDLGDVGLPQLRAVLPPGRENAEAVIEWMEGVVDRNSTEFPDGGSSALQAMGWLRKLLNAEYDAAEEINRET